MKLIIFSVFLRVVRSDWDWLEQGSRKGPVMLMRVKLFGYSTWQISRHGLGLGGISPLMDPQMLHPLDLTIFFSHVLQCLSGCWREMFHLRNLNCTPAPCGDAQGSSWMGSCLLILVTSNLHWFDTVSY